MARVFEDAEGREHRGSDRKAESRPSQTLDFILENGSLFRFVITESKNMEREHLRTVLQPLRTCVMFWRGLLEAVNADRPIKGDIEVLANEILFLQLFQPMRGWTVKHKSSEEVRDTMVDFILRGLGLAEP